MIRREYPCEKSNFMKNIQTFYLIFFLHFLALQVKAQNKPEIFLPIEIKDDKIYFLDQNKLNYQDIYKLVKVNAEAKKLMKRSQSLSSWSYITAYSGGSLIGWQIANFIFGKDVNEFSAGLGLCLAGISLSLDSSAKNKIHDAVTTYNGGSGLSHKNPNIKLGISGNGVGWFVSW